MGLVTIHVPNQSGANSELEKRVVIESSFYNCVLLTRLRKLRFTESSVFRGKELETQAEGERKNPDVEVREVFVFFTLVSWLVTSCGVSAPLDSKSRLCVRWPCSVLFRHFQNLCLGSVSLRVCRGARERMEEKRREAQGRRVCKKLGGGGGWEASPPLPTYLTKLNSFSV